jgi:3-dehydroquinate dehydratase-1
MQELGAHLCKIAVMPKDSGDVLELLQAANDFNKEGDCPFAAISMGPLGKVSRFAGGLFGSALTFASAGRPSAPGQISVEKLRKLLEEIQV